MLRRTLVLVTALSLGPLAVAAPPPANLDQEYDQVRTIALRDPKVRAAFAKANERLEAKIVEIDPALKGYVKGRSTTKAQPAPERKTAVKPPPTKQRTRTHLIVAGDTLSTIAAHYRTTVGALRSANPKVDEKKLQVGESLTIAADPRRGAKP